ncbi:purine-binding chemotaxis protein CheW [Hydrogenophaga palleronii]|uniref:Purine-binding chemotaxis protein CheW n=1 Tax=Hydrogenophaga palleronii TaxID=65655 RepID=A0ABU1WM21_9BURK|nr:chemotaxis protein CheW [Hydrogenophaga palleronii]MDR7150082.1 purine-binding chemotaxis protein CheW [Hydrogenophaga palleronii]
MKSMETPHQLVVFILDDQRYGLPLASVERATRLVEITPLPEAPAIVLGLINVHSRLVPVVNLRHRFRLPWREPTLSDEMIVAHTTRRPVALVVDAVIGVITYTDQQLVGAADILPGTEHLQGVVKLDDGLILIQDLEKFLSMDEARALDAAMACDP